MAVLTSPLPPVPAQTRGTLLTAIQRCVQLWAAKWSAASAPQFPLPSGAQYLPYPAVPNQTEGSTLTSIQNLIVFTFGPLSISTPSGGLYVAFTPGNYQPNNTILTSIQRLLRAWLVAEMPTSIAAYPAVPNQTEGAVLTSIQNILAALLPIVAPTFSIPNDQTYRALPPGNFQTNNYILASIQNLWSAIALHSI